MDCFDSVDAVIMDRPTTALYEAMMSGLPVLALYPDFIQSMIAKDVSVFGKILESFSSNEEAFRKIDQFLKDDPEEYVRTLPLHDDGLAQILKEKKGTACPLCGAPEKVRAYHEGMYAFEDVDYDLKYCRPCALVFVAPTPSPETIRRMYDENYFQKDFRLGNLPGDYKETYESRLPQYEEIGSLA